MGMKSGKYCPTIYSGPDGAVVCHIENFKVIDILIPYDQWNDLDFISLNKKLK